VTHLVAIVAGASLNPYTFASCFAAAAAAFSIRARAFPFALSSISSFALAFALLNASNDPAFEAVSVPPPESSAS
jgi:hypothetical protein